jgi:hypothetical protein
LFPPFVFPTIWQNRSSHDAVEVGSSHDAVEVEVEVEVEVAVTVTVTVTITVTITITLSIEIESSDTRVSLGAFSPAFLSGLVCDV